MAEDEKRISKELIGKLVVSRTGRKFGVVGDISFETRSGELIHIILTNPTPYSTKLELEKDQEGNILLPFSSVQAIGDYVVVSDEDVM